MPHRIAAWVGIALAGAGLCAAQAAQAESLEYAVKAAYLTKFIPFMQWPETAFAAPGAPFNICVMGEDPFGPSLAKAVAGQKIGNHALAVRQAAALDAVADCQILFFGAGDPQTIADAVDAVKDKPVLTITDSGTRMRGIIGFAVIDNHVRFDIDDDAAQAAGIQISSKLLDLARNVKRKGAP